MDELLAHFQACMCLLVYGQWSCHVAAGGIRKGVVPAIAAPRCSCCVPDGGRGGLCAQSQGDIQAQAWRASRWHARASEATPLAPRSKHAFVHPHCSMCFCSHRSRSPCDLSYVIARPVRGSGPQEDRSTAMFAARWSTSLIHVEPQCWACRSEVDLEDCTQMSMSLLPVASNIAK